MKFAVYRLIGFFTRILTGYLILPGILMIFCLVYSQSLFATSAFLQGIVTNGANGMPVTGAKIVVNGQSALSVSGGVYTLVIDPVGTFPVGCTKPGFENYSSIPVAFLAGVTSLLNIQLWENLTPPLSVAVSLDTLSQHVPVIWNPPSGNYELIYDDGIQDNFTIWASQGNMYAMKFTPSGFPVKVTGGAINIGAPANYPAGSNPLVPFQVRVYDASGAGGTPGNSLAGPFDIIPAALGWVEFTFPLPVTVNNGAFYIAMVQGGNAPDAAGIAIDETNPQFRSYSRFVSGGSPWFPAGGNFMIRAWCEGPGGPGFLADDPLTVSSYNLYRLRQGEEQNPSAWNLVGATSATSFTDSTWASLPCGPYRWGVKSHYPGNRWSAVTFSNILGKCWTEPVNIHLDVSCDSVNPAGSTVNMVNLVYTDTVYSAMADSSGIIVFPNAWKGTYKLTAVRFGYDTLTQSVPVASPVQLDITLLQVKMPPANLVVDDSSLLARWDVPRYEKQIFAEKWSSGSFASNMWTTEGGVNWDISAAIGNPAPSAVFLAMPQQTNYAQSLISKYISGQHSTLLKLKYDIYLDNFGTTTMNQMAVEIWDGSNWHILKNYSNAGGNITWTKEDLDISAYTNLNFKLRFLASGGDSYDINNWNIDNIEVVASEPAQEQANCILGYYFYLGNVISGYTTKNAYPIPGNQIQFGQTYNACVRALYGSGYSDFACTSFTSHFLYPVRNIQGYPMEDAAYISWDKPLATTDTSSFFPPGLIGYTIFRNDSVIATINDADSLDFYEYGLEPGYYQYGVAAVYDLNYYGFPGQTGESLPAGPLHITITWGRQLPFFESWNSGSFSYNEWRFTPSQGNWIIDAAEGIPAPAANFRWQPPVVNYNYSLESPSFNGLPFNCAAIWLDFDLKLNDRNYTGTEKMIVEAYYNNTWNKKAEIKNTGSLPWTNYHIDISPARGKGFRVRFRASGQNSSEILNWFIDNVNIYPVCYPASNLAGELIGNSVKLTWSPPDCFGGNLLNEGFEETIFPPLQWTIQTTNPSNTWSHTTAAGLPGVHSGSFSAGLNWDYNHQDEWLIANNIYVNGDLTFWSYAFQGSLHQDHYYIMVSPDHGASWDILMDMSALPPYPGTTGINAWLTPYHIDLSMYDGETVDIAWRAVDGDGNGLWYPWAIDDCTIGADDKSRPVFPTPRTAPGITRSGRYSREVLGYDIYRKAYGANTFSKINPNMVIDTSWFDQGLPLGQYQYFIQVIFNECENATHSDTLMVDVVTGIGALQSSRISVFPNPVTNSFTVTSSAELEEIRLYEASGQPAGIWYPEGKLKMTVDMRGLKAGFYLLMVRSGNEIENFKICFTP